MDGCGELFRSDGEIQNPLALRSAERDNPFVKSAILPAIILSAGLVLSAFVLRELPNDRYEIRSGSSPLPFIFLVDRRTGETWRYYRNEDKSEGFMPLFNPSGGVRR